MVEFPMISSTATVTIFTVVFFNIQHVEKNQRHFSGPQPTRLSHASCICCLRIIDKTPEHEIDTAISKSTLYRRKL